MARWLWDNLRTLALAFLLAVLVWAVAVNEENPIEERVFAQPIPIALLNLPPQLILMEQSARQTALTIRAPRSVWETLSAEQLRVTVDLSSVTAGAYLLPLNVQLDAPTARLTRLDPAAVTLTLEQRARRELPIQLEQRGDIARGYELTGLTLTPLTATITGPASQVDRISEIRATVTLAGLKEDFKDDVPLACLDFDGALVTSLAPDPLTVQVHLGITQKQGFRDVTVSPVITGQVASGYRLTNITVSPPVVTVSSTDPARVSQLPGFIETELLDISGWKEDRAVRLPVRLPEGVTLEGETLVFVQISIAAIEYSQTVQREVEIQNLGEGLDALPAPQKVDILISGPLPVFNQLKPEDVRVFVDLKGLDVGTHQVEPQVNLLLTELRVDKILTHPIEVTLQLRPTPTPTPTLTPTPQLTPTKKR